MRKYTKERLDEMILAFYKKHGHAPTTNDFDTNKDLPSSCVLYANYKNHEEMRKKLKLPKIKIDKPAINRRASESEKDIKEMLISRFGEMFVHEEKKYGVILRCDFFVYCSENFMVDVFYAKDIYSLGGVINIKQKKYAKAGCRVVFLSANKEIDQKTIDKLVGAKKNKLPEEIVVLTKESFEDFIKTFNPIP